MGRQGKRAVFDPDVIVRARAVVDSVSYGDQTLAAVSVLMAEVLKLTGEQIGAVLGVSVPTVVRMNERFRKSETSESNNWGGVRHEVLSVLATCHCRDGFGGPCGGVNCGCNQSVARR